MHVWMKGCSSSLANEISGYKNSGAKAQEANEGAEISCSRKKYHLYKGKMQPRLGRFIISAGWGIRESGRIPRFFIWWCFLQTTEKTKQKQKLSHSPPSFTSSRKSTCFLKQLTKEKIITNILHFSGGSMVWIPFCPTTSSNFMKCLD